MHPEMAKQFKFLEKENARLKKMVANRLSTRRSSGKLVRPERRQRSIGRMRRRTSLSETPLCWEWPAHW